MPERPEVHLRILTPDDVGWVREMRSENEGRLAAPLDWDLDALEGELAEGRWAADDRWAWAILVDGNPVGVAVVVGLRSPAATVEIRIRSAQRGRGVGREVLRELADHHFTASPDLHRLTGRTHEQNVPMQRAFNAAGFRMEARYRDSFRSPDGRVASEWGYGLTRADWESGRHRADDLGYDLHGLTFVVEDVLEGDDRVSSQLLFKFLQEGRRALARYSGGPVVEGELAGILQDDVFLYRWIHEVDRPAEPYVFTGGGRARIQRRQDGRLEVVNDWTADTGHHGTTFLVERR